MCKLYCQVTIEVCAEEAEYFFDQCVIDCGPDHFTCIGQCQVQFHDFLEECPCKSGCPQGCPCPSYQCPSTTSSVSSVTTTAAPKDSVLVLIGLLIESYGFFVSDNLFFSQNIGHFRRLSESRTTRAQPLYY